MSTGFSRVATPEVLLTHQRLRHRKLPVSSESPHRGYLGREGFEAIRDRAALPLLRRLQDRPPEVAAVLVPTLV